MKTYMRKICGIRKKKIKFGIDNVLFSIPIDFFYSITGLKYIEKLLYPHIVKKK